MLRFSSVLCERYAIPLLLLLLAVAATPVIIIVIVHVHTLTHTHMHTQPISDEQRRESVASSGSGLLLRGLRKVFPDGTVAVAGSHLEMLSGQIFCLVCMSVCVSVSLSVYVYTHGNTNATGRTDGRTGRSYLTELNIPSSSRELTAVQGQSVSQSVSLSRPGTSCTTPQDWLAGCLD